MRCIVLARSLKNDFDPYFLVKGDDKIGEILYKENFNFRIAMHGFDEEIKDIKGLHPNLIFLDIKNTPIDFVRKIKEYAPVITLDDIGEGSDAADISIYSLPTINEKPANYNSLKYLIFDTQIDPYNKDSWSKKVKKILVSFGGSDPENLSSIIIRLGKLYPNNIKWNFVRGPFNANKWSNGNYHTVHKPGKLFSLIEDSDLVITSFGMTAYESAVIGTPVLLLNPTEYHEQLTERAGIFNSLGKYSKSAEGDNINEIVSNFSNFLNNYNELIDKAEAAKKGIDKNGIKRISSIIRSLLDKSDKSPCVICGSRSEKSVDRSDKKNIFECTNCGLFYQRYFTKPQFKYEKNYFNDKYAQQYGHTYLEDRLNIDKINKERLNIIQNIHDKTSRKYKLNPKSILDIGSAYGFFLDQARDNDWDCTGVEISHIASKYASDVLKFDIINTAFMEAEIPRETQTAITMWYTIEHIPELDNVIKKCFVSLKRGGILAISTPNSAGYSARLNKKIYIKKIPEDHFFEFSISNMKTLMKKYKFKVMKIRSTGIHYERFLENKKSELWKNNIIKKITLLIMKLLKKGDTFEIYVLKK